MNRHFLLSGDLVYGVVVGVEPTPRRIPSLAKLGMVSAPLPLHAFFGDGLCGDRAAMAPNRARLVNVKDWRHSNDLVRNPRKDGGGIGRGGGACGVCGCRSGAGGSRSRYLRQRPVGIRIRMRRRPRMGRLESGSQLGPARTGQECMVPLEPARSLEGWSPRHPL